MTEPRQDRLCWADRFMLEALLSAGRSPDPNTQVGACIVDPRNRVVGSGYNSFPNNICTRALPWDRSNKDPLETKYPYVVHAEKNAIYNCTSSTNDCTLYVTMFPCNECAKDIIQAGITKVIYLTNPYEDQWQTQAAKTMFDLVDIQLCQHQWETKTTKLFLESLNQKITT